MDYKSLFAKIERQLGGMERAKDPLHTLSAVLRRLVEDFRDDLGIYGGRIYLRDGEAFELRDEYPSDGAHAGFRIPATYPPVQELLRQGFVFRAAGDPEVDPEIEGALNVESFAAIHVVGAGHWIIAFSLEDSSDRDHVIYLLNTIRHAIALHLRQQHLETRVAEARHIQLSLLPSAAPRFAGYDIYGKTDPAEEVGGDLFDFIEVSERALGITIADVAGHGLPAALQGRDVIVGLRMGVEERFRITSTIEKLNRVIGRSSIASRFISMFYAELEPQGTLVYCNAGHNPPLLWRRDGEFEELSRGGTVLGPNPSARYQRGYAELEPGSILLLYTDGIVEAANRGNEMYGVGRLRALLGSHRWTSASDLVDAVFGAVRAFSRTDPPVDDQTVVAVVRED